MKFFFSHFFVNAFKAFIKPFEAPQRSVKIKISLNFSSSSGIGTGKVNMYYYGQMLMEGYIF